MSRKKRFSIISLILNIIIAVLVIYGIFVMQFPKVLRWANDSILESTGVGMFRFYTTDSNFLMALIALAAIPFDIKKIRNDDRVTPSWLSVLYHVGTAAIALTFLVVITYLAPVFGLWHRMYTNANLFYHLIVPVLAMVNAIFFRSDRRLSPFSILYGLIPMALYSILYMIQLQVSGNPTITDPKTGMVTYPNDWYGFAHIPVGGTKENPQYLNFIIVFLLILVAMAILSAALFGLERCLHRAFFPVKQTKAEPKKEETAQNETKQVSVTSEKEPEEIKEAPKQEEAKAEEKTEASEKEQKDEAVPQEEPRPVRTTTTSLKVSELNNGRPDNLYKDKSRVYHISRHSSGGWQVKLASGEKAIKTFPTQKEAITFARDLVRTQGGSIRVHSMTGSIRKA